MVKEELATHKEEREVVQAPANKEESAECVVFHHFG